MRLTCGPFNVHYSNGFLRKIRYGSQEIIRMIYFATRDRNWGTYDLIIKNEAVQRSDDSFAIRYEATNDHDQQMLIHWNVLIEGDRTGEIRFTIQGKVETAFEKNRAGFCVLHPLREVIGQEVEIVHPDGSAEKQTFPEHIAPEDPFKDIASMRWNIGDHRYELVFEGDIFETEDQRNWSDASFKTFCTPLQLPFPVKLKKDDTITQKITFRPLDALPDVQTPEIVRIMVGDEIRRLPSIGVCSSPFEEFNDGIFDTMSDLRLDHYRIDVDLSGIEWEDIFNNDVTIARRLKLPLEIVLHLPEDASEKIRAFIALHRKENIPARNITLLSKGHLTTQQHHLQYVEILKEHFTNSRIGAGTEFNFTELNRHRFDKSTIQYVTFGLDPQEHATDDITIVENIEAQSYAVSSAHHIYDLPVFISPVLLKRKYNPYATDPSAFHIPDIDRRDERQQLPFCAAWTLGSIKAIAGAGGKSVTYYQAIGPHGLISEEGKPYPVFNALKALRAMPAEFRRTVSSEPHIADAFVFPDGRSIIWNYTAAQIDVYVTSHNERLTLQPFEIRFSEG